MKYRLAALGAIVLTLICGAFFAISQPAQAAVSPLVIDLGEAQENGLGGENSYWDLQENISVGFGKGEFLFLFGDLNTRLIYKGGEGGGFMDVGQLSKPAGQEVLQITPALLAYNDTQYIKAGHFYILKTLTLGYFAVYVDDIQAAGNDYPSINFTLYKLKSAPAKASPQPQPQPQPQTQTQPGDINADQGNIEVSGSGRDTISYSDGSVYVGEISSGAPHGAGTMTWPDGSEYRGEWKNGKQDGEGTKTYASGARYIGEWKEGIRDGWGLYSWVNGDKYDGAWKDGKMNGQGKHTRADGTVSEGLWQNDSFIGNSSGVTNNTADKEHPSVMLNGKMLSFDVSPVIENGRTLVPLRAIFEALGAMVSWDEPTQTVTATKGSTQIKLQIGYQAAYKNGTPVNLDVPAKIINDRTLVPLRFVSESLGAEVGWDDSSQTVSITSSGTPARPADPVSPAGAGEPYWVENGVRLVLGGKVIYEDQDSIYYPFISPDGNWLVYSHNEGNLILANLGNGSAQTIYQLDANEELDYGIHPLGWSPDSSRILGMTFHRGGFNGGNKLIILDRSTGGASLVLKGLSSASWSSAGRIVTANASGMKVIDEAGRTIKELTVPQGGFFVNADHPSFTPDGSRVVYHLSNEYYLHDIASDSYENVFSLSQDSDGEGYPRVAGDGRIIFADSKGKVYIYDPGQDNFGVFYDKAQCTYPNWK